jgi:hypothetical protein
MVCFDGGKVCVSDRYCDSVDYFCGCSYCKDDYDRSYFDRPDHCLAVIAGKELESELSDASAPFVPSDVSRAAKLDQLGEKLCALPETDLEQANITKWLTEIFGAPLPLDKDGVKAPWEDRREEAFWGYSNYTYEKAPQVDYVYPSPAGTEIVVCTIYLHDNYHNVERTLQDMYGDNVYVTTSMSSLYAYDFVALKIGDQFYTFTDDFVKHMKAKKSPPAAAATGGAAASVSPIAGDTPAAPATACAATAGNGTKA